MPLATHLGTGMPGLQLPSGVDRNASALKTPANCGRCPGMRRLRAGQRHRVNYCRHRLQRWRARGLQCRCWRAVDRPSQMLVEISKPKSRVCSSIAFAISSWPIATSTACIIRRVRSTVANMSTALLRCEGQGGVSRTSPVVSIDFVGSFALHRHAVGGGCAPRISFMAGNHPMLGAAAAAVVGRRCFACVAPAERDGVPLVQPSFPRSSRSKDRCPIPTHRSLPGRGP